MSVNKVQLANGETIIDISDSTVTPETLAKGATAYDASGKKIIGQMVGSDDSTIVRDAYGTAIILYDSGEHSLRGLNLYGKTTQNGTPTPTAPIPLESVGADGNVAVTVCGKNLLDISSYPLTKGAYINYLAGTYVFDGDTSQKATADHIPVEHLQGKTIAMNFNASYTVPGVAFYADAYDADYISGCKPGVITVPDNARFMRITADSVYEDLQIEIGSISTEYEPYKESQALTAQTPNGLLGIPVSSGGNYTDENGQMWICDEIDFARGKKVQRVGRIASYAGENISTPYMSTTGELSNGAEVLYALATPIETALTVQQIAQYSELHTNYPNTTIFNDEGAGMGVKYVVDTKLYIDTRYAELATAILNA